MPDKVTIATRGSRLALWQANWVAEALQTRHPGLLVELLTIKTKGDVILDVPLAKVGGKGLFVKEIEEALLDGRADLAVHSMKDVPMHLPEGLTLGVMPERAEPEDLFLSINYTSLEALPAGARVGTSSLRRQAQVLALRPDLQVITLRGNVDTRLQKLHDGHYEAIIMAAAGMARLGLTAPQALKFDPRHFLPAAGQGALGIEYAMHRDDLRALLDGLEHLPTRLCVEAERAFMAALDGNCQTPIAAYATVDGDGLRLEALVALPDGSKVIREALSTKGFDNSRELGQKLADRLRSLGAEAVLAESRAQD